MAQTQITLAEKFAPYVDEQFTTESKIDLLTSNDFTWDGAHYIKVYKISTSPMNDYDRPGTGTQWSRYGAIGTLDATTETFNLTRDRSFTFCIDQLDTNETVFMLEASTALARQNREVVIPEVDQYMYNVMATNAGTKPAAIALTADNIYDQVIAANAVLDEAMVPETQRALVVTPAVYVLLKKSASVMMQTDIAQEMRNKGVIGTIDGVTVIKVPASRLPSGFGFMLAHPCATVAPVKLRSFQAHTNPPGINGSLVEGRINYDAFVLDNKKKAIYYQAMTA